MRTPPTEGGAPRRHVYGPVPSRRYGLSLGIDVLPPKVCSYDCVYCQCGPTTDLSVERQDFYPVADVVSDVVAALERGPRPEVLTLAGSGEPTLYRSLGALIEGLHAACDIPVLVLTNGSLLGRPDVRADLRAADLVVPSLDAGDPKTFARINGPHPVVTFDRMVEGIRDLVREHVGRVRIEVMLVKGVNDTVAQVEAIAAIVRDLGVEGVDLNVPVRPSPGRAVAVPDAAALETATRLFGPTARVAALVRRQARPQAGGDARSAVLDLVCRRPCTRQDMADALGFSPSTLDSALASLLAEGRVREDPKEDRVYFLPS